MFLLAAARFAYLSEQGNFHVITEGRAYRSAQLDRDELEHYVLKYGIRSVINLRGRSDGSRWHEEEKETCRRLAVRLYDEQLSARRRPTDDELTELIRALRTAERPVLIHCRSGADRAGLAAAIWKVMVDGASKEEAQKQLSLFFGHFRWGPAGALDGFFRDWQPRRTTSGFMQGRGEHEWNRIPS